ncbi:hypothetical protein J6Y73_05575 [bacterium]|nr:hypothetical protein [bacterium]
MNKFLFSSILEELNQEILYTTFNYDKEKLGYKEFKKLGEDDFKNLKKNQALNKMAYFLEELSKKHQDSKYEFDPDLIKILDEREYDLDKIKYIYDLLDPYIDYYHKMMKKIIDHISKTLDLKENQDGFIGEFPIYIKLEEHNCKLERAIVSVNSKDYLYGNAKNFSYKVTFMDFDVPLKEPYSYNSKNLKDLPPVEILRIFDESIKINLNNCKYFETDSIVIDTESEELNLLDMGSESLWLNKKKVTYSGVKLALKHSLKRTFLTFIIIVVVTIIILIIKELL